MCARRECKMCIFQGFDSEVCYRIATDCMHILADALNADRKTEQTESLEQFRVGLEYHTDATHFGKAKGKSVTTDTADTPQTDCSVITDTSCQVLDGWQTREKPKTTDCGWK